MGSSDGGDCFGLCVCILVCCGAIILLTGGIGYGVSKREHDIFDKTTCNVTAHQDLTTKDCEWCDSYCSGYSCNCNSKGTSCSCCHACHYKDYTCYKAIWNVKYETLDHADDDCPEKMKSTIHGDWKKSYGDNASENSRDKATRDLKSRPVNSKETCYYKSE